MAAIVAVAAGTAVFAQTAIRTEAPDVVAADEQFSVTFVIEGSDRPSDFSWTPGDDFQLVWGPQQGSSTSMNIENGKRTVSSRFTYTYILLPKKTGSFSIPEARAKVKGKDIASGTASIEVVGSQEKPSSGDDRQQGRQTGQQERTIGDEDIFMNLSVSKSRVVVGEPVTATLKLYQRVNVSGFEDARFPTFNGFWSQEIEAPTNIEFRRENLDGKIYNTALLRKWVIIPQQAGVMTVDPAELVCLVQVRVSSSGGVSIFDGFFDDYRTIRKRVYSGACRLDVSPLPAGAPANFGGGVGSFGITAKFSKDSLATHEAASLIVTVSGRGNVSLLEAPSVSFPPDFEVYDTRISEKTDKSSGGTSGSKTYEFPFIPRSHGDFTVPGISYSYYDINSGRYVTLRTDDMHIRVAKGKEVQDQQTGVPAMQGGRSGVRNLNEDIRFIAVKMPALSPAGAFFVLSPLFWCLLAAVVLVAAAAWAALRKMAARRADIAGMRTRKANKIALRHLRMAGDFLKQDLRAAFYEELHKALLGYVSDKLNIAVADLSKEKISSSLAAGNAGEDTAAKFIAILDACEFARYAPDAGHGAMEAHYEEAVQVISSIESEMKGKRKNAGGAAGAVIVAAVLLSMPSSAGASARDSYADSLWRQATEAYSAGLWEESAAAYEDIAASGLESAALYCNTGNAYFKSGDAPRAILWYERALKLDPSFSDARYNLEIASHRIQDRIDPVPEFILAQWMRKVCWMIDSDAWASVALAFFAVCAGMVLLFLLGASPAARKTGFFTAVAAFVLFGSALSFSLWQRADYMKADSAIVMRPVSSVKSSPAQGTATDLFVLHEGTKVTILDEVGEWRNISLADGRQGWMPAEDMEII